MIFRRLDRNYQVQNRELEQLVNDESPVQKKRCFLVRPIYALNDYLCKSSTKAIIDYFSRG